MTRWVSSDEFVKMAEARGLADLPPANVIPRVKRRLQDGAVVWSGEDLERVLDEQRELRAAAVEKSLKEPRPSDDIYQAYNQAFAHTHPNADMRQRFDFNTLPGTMK